MKEKDKWKAGIKMIEYKDECIGCPAEMGCLGSSCPNINIPHLYCDNCGGEQDELYIYEESELCKDCLLKMFERIILE